MTQPFEPQPKESTKAFEAFQVYLNMEGKRSTLAVAKRLAKNHQLIRRWSARHRWIERVKAYAARLATVQDEATVAHARSTSAVWLERMEQLREEQWELRSECMKAVRKALKTFIDREKPYANLADISRMLEVASKLGRQAAETPTQSTESIGQQDGAFRAELEAAIQKIYGDVIELEVVEVAKASGPLQIADRPAPIAEVP